MNKIIFGCLPEQIDRNAFGIFDVENIPFRHANYYNNKISYNQGMTMFCTIYSHLTNISNTFNIVFAERQINDCVDYCTEEAKKEGFDLPKNGWWLNKSADAVRKWYNYTFDKQIKYFTCLIGTPLFYELLSKGYMISTGIYYNTEYVKDVYDNGIVDRSDYELTGNLNIGHALNMERDENGLGNIKMIDNRSGNKYNVYILKDVEDLIKDKVLFTTGYIWYSDEEEIANKVDEKLTKRFEGKFILNVEGNGELARIVNGKKKYYKTIQDIASDRTIVTGVNKDNWSKIGK